MTAIVFGPESLTTAMALPVFLMLVERAKMVAAKLVVVVDSKRRKS